MSQNPKVEAKIVEELKSNGLLATPEKPSPRPIEWDDIPKLTYLNAVIKASAQPGHYTQYFLSEFQGFRNFREGCLCTASGTLAT